jgi:ABC-type phosphate transport system permease subunit
LPHELDDRGELETKKSSERNSEDFFSIIYDVGGSVSLLETSATAASGFLRSMKKPTAMGMAIKMKEKQSIAIPAPAGIVPELLTPFNSVVYGIIPAAVTAPKMHKHKPGHPHNTTAAMVATIPFVFVSIFFSPLVN